MLTTQAMHVFLELPLNALNASKRLHFGSDSCNPYLIGFNFICHYMKSDVPNETKT